MTEARIVSDEPPGTVRRITVTGEIDLANAADVERTVFSLTTNQLTRLVLDLGGLRYIDSAGLRVLFVLATRLEISQIVLELVVPDGSAVRRAVELAGMEAMVPIRAEG